jgi:hypothetical protein
MSKSVLANRISAKTIDLLRKQSEAGGPDSGKDARLDLKEAEAAERSTIPKKQSALRAADGARAKALAFSKPKRSARLRSDGLPRRCARGPNRM